MSEYKTRAFTLSSNVIFMFSTNKQVAGSVILRSTEITAAFFQIVGSELTTYQLMALDGVRAYL